MWANFHMHNKFCDGSGEPEEYVAQAIAAGIHYLGFSSHAPVPFDCKWCMKKENLSDYLTTIDLLRKKYPSLQIYKGLETDFVPGAASPRDYRSILDYTIGSIHFIDAFPDGKPWEIDGSHSVFLEGLTSIFKNDIRAAITRYFELTREMISAGCPDIIGHLDKIKIQNPGEKFYRESDTWYQQEIDKTLSDIAEAGAIIEVNTRGLYQKKTTTPYPSSWILEKIHRLNIPVTLSSDAHHPKDIINQFEETAALLLSIGFKKISILKDGSWQPVTLTLNGVVC